MDGTARRHLRQPLALGLIERSTKRHVRLDALDPAVGALVTAHAVVGVHAVVLDLDPDLLERDTLVVGIEPQGDRDASHEAPEQDLVGCGPGIRSPSADRLVAEPGEVAGTYRCLSAFAKYTGHNRHYPFLLVIVDTMPAFTDAGTHGFANELDDVYRCSPAVNRPDRNPVEMHQQHSESHAESDASHSMEEGRVRLATSATIHCLAGCGLGEVAGVIVGVALGLTRFATLALAVSLGFVFGFALGLIPLYRAGYTTRRAFKQVLVAEGLSIAVMETFEVLVEVYTPGVMSSGLSSPIFWLGMGLALTAGFIAAWPVNYWLVGKGIQHVH